ncbi:MAG: metal-dependent hydrolase [Anaeromyxobacter sp.]|nr:metal-dependent hydrolase [Anaeromyxobacter sp.]MBL0277260.1 metal-dependent hydrolase [Anaeromyxobacter sp.]
MHTSAAAPLTLLAATLALAAPAASAASPKGATEVTWYGHAAFVVKTPGGTVLAIDPFFANGKSPAKDLAQTIEKVDYVLVTHGHFDHVGEAVALGKRTGAKLITNFDLGQALKGAGYPEAQAGFDTLGNVGGAIQAGDATVIMVPAIHSSGFADEKGEHGGGSPMGFVIQVRGGPVLYHTGDTDVTMDMKQIPERYGRVDVLLACIGGHFTMDPKGAALAASYVKARTVVPMHYQTFPVIPGSPAELQAALKGRSAMRVLEPGVAATF